MESISKSDVQYEFSIFVLILILDIFIDFSGWQVKGSSLTMATAEGCLCLLAFIHAEMV